MRKRAKAILEEIDLRDRLLNIVNQIAGILSKSQTVNFSNDLTVCMGMI